MKQPQIYFITFPTKVSPAQAKEILAELRRIYPAQFVFTPRPPAGRKKILNISGTTVIVTFPFNTQRQESEQTPTKEEPTQGFKLKDLIKNKT
jgi:hypothetical protein